MGVVGIHIHGLMNKDRLTSTRGENPFNYINYGNTRLSSVVKCYDPAGRTSKERYAWIDQNLANVVEEAILIRKQSR